VLGACRPYGRVAPGNITWTMHMKWNSIKRQVIHTYANYISCNMYSL
jgi:hypothetical protein